MSGWTKLDAACARMDVLARKDADLAVYRGEGAGKKAQELVDKLRGEGYTNLKIGMLGKSTGDGFVVTGDKPKK